jgi:hypothetical protein
MRERGHAVACAGCGGEIDVPANLDFPHYVDLFEDRVLATNVELAVVASAVLCCAPVAASAWWFASGAAQRARDEGRPLDPALVRARNIAAAATVLEAVVLAALFAASVRF